jgi:hypothetical protein
MGTGNIEGTRAMNQPDDKSQRLVGVFLLGTLLFNFPLLALFNRAASAFGVPLLYAYVFVSWALVIGLLALVVERSR